MKTRALPCRPALCLLLAGLLLAGGCQFFKDLKNQMYPPPEPATVALPPQAASGDQPPEEDPWVTTMILDESLLRRVTVESTQARRTPSGHLEVWAMLRNQTNQAVQVEGRVQFFDRKRAPVEGPTAWKRIFLPPHGLQAYYGYSTGTKGAQLYYVEIREAR